MKSYRAFTVQVPNLHSGIPLEGRIGHRDRSRDRGKAFQTGTHRQCRPSSVEHTPGRCLNAKFKVRLMSLFSIGCIFYEKKLPWNVFPSTVKVETYPWPMMKSVLTERFISLRSASRVITVITSGSDRISASIVYSGIFPWG